MRQTGFVPLFNKHLLSVSHVVQFLSHRHSVRDSAIRGIIIPVIRLLHLLKLTSLAGPREELPKQRHVSAKALWWEQISKSKYQEVHYSRDEMNKKITCRRGNLDHAQVPARHQLVGGT